MEALVASTGAHGQSPYRLLRMLTGTGVVREESDGRFSLTPLGEPLRSDVLGSVPDWALYVGARAPWDAWGRLHDAVMSGTTGFELADGVPTYEYLAQHPEVGGALRSVDDPPIGAAQPGHPRGARPHGRGDGCRHRRRARLAARRHPPGQPVDDRHSPRPAPCRRRPCGPRRPRTRHRQPRRVARGPGSRRDEGPEPTSSVGTSGPAAHRVPLPQPSPLRVLRTADVGRPATEPLLPLPAEPPAPHRHPRRRSTSERSLWSKPSSPTWRPPCSVPTASTTGARPSPPTRSPRTSLPYKPAWWSWRAPDPAPGGRARRAGYHPGPAPSIRRAHRRARGLRRGEEQGAGTTV